MRRIVFHRRAGFRAILQQHEPADKRFGLRADSRFKDILRDLGLVDYWRSTGNWGDFCKPVGAEDFECS